ncbi:hypothetical protein GTQ40_16475 [Flavobacteriaceae bacterium R38]|nr:hypothetical protein [Flavobacteriaceae bacterium R38]
MKKIKKLSLKKIKIAAINYSYNLKGGVEEFTIIPISGQICSEHQHTCNGQPAAPVDDGGGTGGGGTSTGHACATTDGPSRTCLSRICL